MNGKYNVCRVLRLNSEITIGLRPIRIATENSLPRSERKARVPEDLVHREGWGKVKKVVKWTCITGLRAGKSSPTNKQNPDHCS